MNQALSKRIILTPDQLRRLMGHDRELTKSTDAARMSALLSAAKTAPIIGPGQAYAQFNAVQQRHLHQAAHERSAPLELVVSEPDGSTQVKSKTRVVEDLINFSEETETPKPNKPPKVGKAPKTPKTPRKNVSRVKIHTKRTASPSSSKTRSRVIVHAKPSPRQTRSKARQTQSGGSPWLKYGPGQ